MTTLRSITFILRVYRLSSSLLPSSHAFPASHLHALACRWSETLCVAHELRMVEGAAERQGKWKQNCQNLDMLSAMPSLANVPPYGWKSCR